VYVRDLSAGTTTEMLGDQYQNTLHRIDGITVIDREDVTIPSGSAVRLTATRAHPGDPQRVLERLVSYTQANGGHSYHFVFVSGDSTGDAYGLVFEAIPRSVRYLVPGAR
jgi:hypothetical protein